MYYPEQVQNLGCNPQTTLTPSILLKEYFLFLQFFTICLIVQVKCHIGLEFEAKSLRTQIVPLGEDEDIASIEDDFSKKSFNFQDEDHVSISKRATTDEHLGLRGHHISERSPEPGKHSRGHRGYGHKHGGGKGFSKHRSHGHKHGHGKKHFGKRSEPKNQKGEFESQKNNIYIYIYLKKHFQGVKINNLLIVKFN